MAILELSVSSQSGVGNNSFLGRPEDQRILTTPVRELIVDASTRTVRFKDLHFPLKATSCRLLTLLLRHQGSVVSRTTIYEEIWGYQFNPGTKIIEVQICYLRKMLKSLQAPFEIRTLRGRGLTIRAVGGGS
ncbi:winged helix-turn-helix transcriptional regulator [Pseudomonas putida]|uniref:winged helix-turn-helix domain-containing protein n=1 Tax=Pseudomonas putida TaxID=303 RepID=UPI0018AB8825|nr:winged helix-turn-helix transcriptional regulator [Pseudomonas putida]MBF8710809.1 winged helix-turn-helix transcriptional regulator [Pseudomonas putida]